MNVSGKFGLADFLKKRALKLLPLYFLLLLIFLIANHFLPPAMIERTNIVKTPKETWTVDQAVPPESLYLLKNANGESATLIIDQKSNSAQLFRGKNQSQALAGSLAEFGLKSPLLNQGDVITINERTGTDIDFFASWNPKAPILPYFVMADGFIHGPKLTMLSHLWFVKTIALFYVLYGAFFFILIRIVPNPQNRKTVLLSFLSVLSVLTIFSQKSLVPLPILLGCIFKILEAYYIAPVNRFWKTILPVFLVLAGAAVVAITAYRQIQPGIGIEFACLAVIAGMLRLDAVSAKILENAPLRWIGRNSYGIYLFHNFFLVFSVEFFRDYLHSGNFISVLAFIVVAVLTGAAMEKLVDNIRPLKPARLVKPANSSS